MNQNFNKMKKFENFIQQLFKTELIHVDELEITVVNGKLVITYNGQDFTFEYQGQRIFADLELEFELPYELFQQVNKCVHCDGSGIVEKLQCVDQSNECCGGCFAFDECECELPFND